MKVRAAVIAAVLAGGCLALTGAVPAGHASEGRARGAATRIAAKAPPGVARAPAGASVGNATASYATNWSGYAQNGSKTKVFTAVRDSWKVPKVTPSSGNTYSSDWVGIDGYSNADLVQCGTGSQSVGGVVSYNAWTEIIPANEVVLSGLAIHAGDHIMAEVVETKTNTWKMEVSDLTTGKSASRTVSYTTPEQSVEAIHERPVVGGSLSNLAKTTNATFDPGSYSTAAPGATPVFHPLLTAASGETLFQIFMVNSAGTAIIASPSAPDSDKDGFTVADGSKSPPPPSS